MRAELNSVPMSSSFNILRKTITRFTPFPEEDWEMLLSHLQIKTLKKHDLFAQEGKRANEVAVVFEGMLRQFYLNDGEEKTTYFYFENHLMGAYISCLTGKPSDITIEALSDCTLIVFPYDKVNQLFAESLAWQKFCRYLAEYLAMGLEERMAGLLMLTPEERYRDLIAGNKTKILERIPQHYVANYLGITPVSLSRIRNRVHKK